jgi:hypothetical protein
MIILGTNSIKDTGFNVDNSARFNDGSSDFLSRTFSGAPSNAKIFTISIWTKKSLNGINNALYGKDENGSGTASQIYFDTSDRLRFFDSTSGSNMDILTNRKFRDPSAWYHIVWSVDSTQGTDTNRVKLYVNGVQETSFSTSTYVGQNASFVATDNGKITILGVNENTGGTKYGYYNGYMSEFVFIDGSQLAPTSFGEFDSDSGIWKPIDVSGLTFGTNGFYLDFEDSSALGADVSGNTNNFTVNNLTAIDQSTDTCTNNFATLNPLIFESSGNTFAEGNLKITSGGSDSWTTHYGLSTIAVSTGKWFVEAKVTTVQASQGILGIISTSQNITSSLKDNGVATVEKSGRITGGGNNLQTGLTAFSNGDIAGLSFDATNGTAQFYRNGSAYGSAVSSIASDTYYFATTTYQSGGVVEFNFGSPPYSESGGNSDGDGYGNFSMAVPSGYYALNTKNLAEYG